MPEAVQLKPGVRDPVCRPRGPYPVCRLHNRQREPHLPPPASLCAGHPACPPAQLGARGRSADPTRTSSQDPRVPLEKGPDCTSGRCCGHHTSMGNWVSGACWRGARAALTARAERAAAPPHPVPRGCPAEGSLSGRHSPHSTPSGTPLGATLCPKAVVSSV